MHNMQQAAILVVDDDESIAFMLKMLLEHRGYTVIVNQDAKDLQTIINKNNIGLIILDMLISGVKGTNVCMELKNNDATKHIPVMMMTALPGIEKQCAEAGANDFIAKPFEIDLLLAKVKAFIK
jgi:DNA-binding response OmpR family regulator